MYHNKQNAYECPLLIAFLFVVSSLSLLHRHFQFREIRQTKLMYVKFIASLVAVICNYLIKTLQFNSVERDILPWIEECSIFQCFAFKSVYL